MSEGFIYVLFNPALREGHFKIGKTVRTPKERAAEISGSTGVPIPFEVIYEEKVKDCHAAESLVHAALRSKRVSTNREFFQVELKEAIGAIQRAVEKVGRVNSGNLELDDIEDGSGPTESATANIEADSEIDVELPEKPAKSAKNESLKQRQQLRFWKAFLEHLGDNSAELREVRPSAYYFCVTDRIATNVYFCFTLNNSSIRIEIFIATNDRDYNQSIFKHLVKKKQAIQETFGAALDWRAGTTCGIKYLIGQGDYRLEEDWPSLFAASAGVHQRFVSAIKPHALAACR